MNLFQSTLHTVSVFFLICVLLSCRSQCQAQEYTSPYSIEAGLTQIYQANAHGGLSTHQHKGRYSGSYDVGVSLDMARLSNRLSGQFFMHGEGGWTDSGGIDSHSVGSVFGVNADAIGNRSLDVVEAFYTNTFLTSGLTFHMGKIDFTGFYDTSAYANDETSQFLNSALVNNPTIPFPDYSLGVIVAWDIATNWSFMAGIADAQAVGKTTGHRTTFHGEDYFFSIFELACMTFVNSHNGPLNGTIRVGLWNDPQPKSHSDSTHTQRDDWGYYISADHMLTHENEDVDDPQGLGVFLRYGHSNDQKNDIAQFISLGLHYQGLLDTRDRDVFGLGLAQGTFSNHAAQTYTQDHERITELYYKAVLCDHFHVTPTLQYINNPGGIQTSDSLVAGIRGQLDF